MRQNFFKLEKIFERKGLEVNILELELQIRGSAQELNTGAVDTCGVCNKKVMFDSLFQMQLSESCSTFKTTKK